MKLTYLLFFLSIILSSSVTALSITGDQMPVTVYYEQGKEPVYTYTFGTDSITQDYIVLKAYDKGYDITPFLEISKTKFESVPQNAGAEFSVKINMNEPSIPPGMHESLIVVRETKTAAGTVGGLAEVAVRFRIISLYPTEFIDWRVYGTNANEGEDATFTARLENWGVPDINDAQISYLIYDKENNLVGEVSTEVISIKSKEKLEIKTKFSTEGLPPDNYRARAKLSFAGLEEIKEVQFRIGEKNVLINSMTSSFLPEAINRVSVNIESGWNSVLYDIEGKIQIYPRDSNEKITEFRLLSVSLLPWDKIAMEGYFDTSGIGLGEYDALVTLEYEDAISQKRFPILIEEASTTETVEQVPGILSLLTIENGLFIMLLIVLGINVWYLLRRRKS